MSNNLSGVYLGEVFLLMKHSSMVVIKNCSQEQFVYGHCQILTFFGAFGRFLPFFAAVLWCEFSGCPTTFL